MRPSLQFVAGCILCAVAAPEALSRQEPAPQPARPAPATAGRGPKQVKLVVGNLLAADKANGAFQGFGPALIRTELTRGVGRNHGIKLFTLLERDQNFQLDEKIEDDERRGATLKPSTVKKLADNQINYFIFLTYASVDGEHIKLLGQLAKVELGRTYVVQSEKTVVNSQDPQLTTFGQNLYLDILKEEGVDYTSHSFSLVFCSGNTGVDPATEYLHSSVKRSFTGERPRLVDAIRGRTCADAEQGSADEILVHYKIVPKMYIEVELMYRDQVVALGVLRIVSLEELMQDRECDKKIDLLIQQIRESYGGWSPPI